MARQFDVASDATFDAGVTIRASQRLDDDTLAVLLGEPVRANDHLTGVPAARGAAAFDGDPATSWITSFGSPVGSAVNVRLDGTASSHDRHAARRHVLADHRAAGERLGRLVRPAGVAGAECDPRLPPSGLAGRRDVRDHRCRRAHHSRPPVRRDGRAAGGHLRDHLRDRWRRRCRPPSPPLGRSRRIVPSCCRSTGSRSGCRSPPPPSRSCDGSPIDATVCDSIELDAGTHVLESSTALTGFDVDQVVLAQPASRRCCAGRRVPTAALTDSSRDSRTVEVSACPTGCWVVLGEGFNTGWSASTESGSLGEPVLVDGNANGWWLEPSTTPTTVTITWASQPFLERCAAGVAASASSPRWRWPSSIVAATPITS